MKKNSAKCVKFICKKHCELRQIHMQETLRIASNLCAKKSLRNASIFCKFCRVSCIYIRRIFQCFLQENRKNIVWQLCIFFKLFRDDFYGTVCRDGKCGIPVKSRCKFGNPDRDCTENIRFCSAKSTKSEIEMKGWKSDGLFLYLQAFSWWILMTMSLGMGWAGILWKLSHRNR